MFIEAGFGYLRFGQVVLDEVKKRGLPPTEENERPIREQLRQQHGMAALATLNLPRFKRLLKKGHVLGDGMYSFAEYKVLKKEFADRFITIAVYAPPSLRYQRLSVRQLAKDDFKYVNRPLTPQQAQSRDYAEIEQLDKGGTIAIADYTILNTKDLTHLQVQTKEIIDTLQGTKKGLSNHR